MSPHASSFESLGSHSPTHWRKIFGTEDSAAHGNLVRLCPESNPLGRTGEDVRGPITGSLLFSFDDDRESVEIEPLIVFSAVDDDDHPDLVDAGR